MKSHVLPGFLFALSCAAPSPGTIYGVKSAPGDPTAPPAYLFACREDGSSQQVIGPLRIGGELVDVDALAMDATDALYGFEITSEGSRLLSIDVSTATAVRIGPLLAGRALRAAAFDASDALRALDVNDAHLLTIDAAGSVVSSRVVTLGGSPIQPAAACDIAFDADGSAWLASDDDLFRLDADTGALTFARLVQGRSLAGLCRSIHAIGSDHLFFGHASTRVDAGWVRIEHDYAMLILYHNIAPVISTGLADLAGRITPDPTRCAGDADADGAVTFSDLNLVLDGWGDTVPPGTLGDVTGDGLVNFADINLVLDAWADGCEEP